MLFKNFKWFYLNLSGRVSRKTYWIYYIIPFVLTCSILTVISDEMIEEVSIIFIPTILLVFFMLTCGTVKRQHDIGLSGWINLIIIIPIVGLIYCFVYLGLKPSQNIDNIYGKLSEINKGEECQN